MPAWEKLAEARIREWMQRPTKDRACALDNTLPVASLEVQLLEEIFQLYRTAAESTDASEAEALRKKASGLETRLLVTLENSERPLAAQYFATLLHEARAKR